MDVESLGSSPYIYSMIRNKNIANVFMVLGLLLLCVLLFLWNYSDYQENKKQTKQQVDFIFTDIIQELNNHILEENINNKMHSDSSYSLEIINLDSFVSFTSSMKNVEMADTFNFDMTVSFDDDSMEGKHVVGPVHVPNGTRAFKNTSLMDKRVSIFTMLVNESGEEDVFYSDKNAKKLKIKSSFKIWNPNLDVDGLLNQFFNNNVDKEQLSPIQLVLKKTTKKDVAILDQFISKVCYDSSPNNLYYLEIKNHTSYIFRKILPQIILSFFVLGFIGIAFYLIHKSLSEMEGLNAMKESFVDNMTHELKTPITTASVALEAVNNFGVDQDADLMKKYLEISQLELNRLSLLVNKVLDISKFRNSELVIEKNTLNLEGLLGNILKTMQIQFENIKMGLKLDKEGNDFYFEGDESHFTNLIYNLIDNSIKYKGENPTLNIRIKEKNNHLILEIKDNGIGIPKKYQEQIFDHFFRVPTKDIHNVKGYGLGLSYVKKIIELHDGKIKMESEEGKGAKFIIEIPKNKHAES